MRTFQVTLGAAATRLLPPELVGSPTNTPTNIRVAFQQLIIQNNSLDNVRVGDAGVTATAGILLGPGGTITIAPPLEYATDLSDYWLFGTANDVVDVMMLE